MIEEWRDIEGFEGLYQVSNLGEVRSFYKNKKLKPFRSMGHFVVHLSKNKTRTIKRVHHLVLEAFVGPRPDGMECRHFPDRNTTNNKLDNLIWGTRSENCADRELQGTSQRGEGNPCVKLSNSKIAEIRLLVAQGEPQRTIAAMFDVSQSLVSRIVTGNRWSHI